MRHSRYPVIRWESLWLRYGFDTARLKYQVGRHLDVDSRSVHAVIIGEHGDSELPVWSGANVSGIDLNHFCELRGHFNHEASMERLYEEVRDSAYEIIERKGATYYGIAMAVARIAESIVKDEHAVLPVSVELQESTVCPVWHSASVGGRQERNREGA